MFGVLSRGRRGPIGLDVGSEGVKMLQLEQNGGKLSVTTAARWSFPPQVTAEASDRRLRRRLAAQAVAEMLKSGHFRGRRVVSCLRADELAIKNIRLPQMPASDLASAVSWEARERFGFEVSPDRLHYLRAGEVRQGAESRDEIILIAASEDSVREHLDMLSEMHLKPAHVDAEPVALFRAYQRCLRRAEDESAVTVVADIGLEATKVIVARGTDIVLIKLIEMGGRTLNESVAKELGLDYTEAVHLRHKRTAKGRPTPAETPSDEVEWSVFDSVRGEVESLAREISLCLRYCAVTFRGLRPSEITLTGGEAYDPAVVRLLSECLDCRCVVGEPLWGMEISGADLGADRRSALTEWSVAAGLALRELDPKVYSRKRVDEERRVSA